MLRSDVPEKVRYSDKGRAVLKGEKYLVCKRNGTKEIIIQSERDADRAQHSVDVMNEHEENNARDPVYYCRLRKAHE